MGTYLEDYVESMYMLPSEIKRNFDLMRELDQTSYPLLEELKSSHRAFLREARAKVVARCADNSQDEPDEDELRALVDADERLTTLRDTHARVVQQLDEKIAIAAQSYDIVDHHIRRLDQDLEAYAALLRANGEFEEDAKPRKKHKTSAVQAGSATVATVVTPTALGQAQAAQAQVTQHTPQSRTKAGSFSAPSGGMGLTPTGTAGMTNVGRASVLAGTTSGGRKRSAAEAALDVAVMPTEPALAVEDLPIDPNEPVYCSCRRVSFGQMVGCDNDDCKYEWFHFGCVGLADQPQGKWYCPDCRVVLGIK